jgi:hypothetical protein
VTLLERIVLVETLALFLSTLCLTPVVLVQALGGGWAGLRVYVRAAAWGALFIVASCFAAGFLS